MTRPRASAGRAGEAGGGPAQRSAEVVPFAAGSLGDRVYATLVRQISSGELAPNSRLPGEIELAHRLGVSRPVLRQALARLRAEGMVYARKGAGNYVQRPAEWPAVDFGPLKNLPDVQRCLDFRCGLESEAAWRAAHARDQASVDAIDAAMQAIERAQDAEQSLEADFDLHLAIARATRNRFFVTTLQALRPQVTFSINLIRSLSTSPHARRSREVRDEHAAIVEAIRAGDAETAKSAMGRHLRAGIARLFNE